MVGSKYNYFVPDGSEVICLNGISHKVFSVSKGSYEYITQLIENKGLLEFGVMGIANGILTIYTPYV